MASTDDDHSMPVRPNGRRRAKGQDVSGGECWPPWDESDNDDLLDVERKGKRRGAIHGRPAKQEAIRDNRKILGVMPNVEEREEM